MIAIAVARGPDAADSTTGAARRSAVTRSPDAGAASATTRATDSEQRVSFTPNT